MTRWLSIVGIGADGSSGLAPAARDLIKQAQFLYGGARHLALVPDGLATRVEWSKPLSVSIGEILSLKPQRVCVLASGDPMWFGIGVQLASAVPSEELVIVSAPSAFSLSAAWLGWPLSKTSMLSLHGRAIETVEREIEPGARFIALTNDGNTAGDVALRLVARGFGRSKMTVLEELGGPEERVRQVLAEDFNLIDIHDLNTIAVDCCCADKPAIYSDVPGLDDDFFIHDGQITKKEVRAITLARLAPSREGILWDLGAGSGAISIEWMRASTQAHAYAVERDVGRAEAIRKNAARFGVPDISILNCEMADALDVLPPPDAVFIGGGLGSDDGEREVGRAYQALNPGGRMVANAITVLGDAALLRLHERFGGDLTRIAISRAAPVGRQLGWRPLMPVTQWTVTKSWSDGTA
jgi:precorrin-6Y C5,15-methyltransferase (decarboxylating)